MNCLRKAFQPYEDQYTPGAYRHTVLTKESIQQRLATMSIIVAADQDGNIVGTIGCHRLSSEEGHLRGMAVQSDWQGSGVAGRLLAAAEDELGMLGCRKVTLGMTEPLQRAIKFYEHNGYRRTGEVSNFFGMQLHKYEKLL